MFVKPCEAFSAGVLCAGISAGQVLDRRGGRAGPLVEFWTQQPEDQVVSCTCVGVLGQSVLLCPSPSLYSHLPALLLFVLHMPGPCSAQTVEISFAENYTSDQNVS